MSLQLTPSAPSSSQFGLSSSNFLSPGVIGVVNGVRSGAALQGGGYYSSIGGGAAPFGPVLNMRSLENGALLKSCVRHIHRTNRKQRAPPIDRRNNDSDLFLRFSDHGSNNFGQPSFQQDGSTRTGKLYCRSGYHLQIHKDGKVNGTRQENNRFGVLEFLSVAFGLVSIKGKESNRYLCMNKRGRLYGSTKHTGECIFMEKMLENYYNTYTSCRYGRGRHSKKKWYVALNKRGRPKRGNQSRKKHKFTQFLVLHLDDEDYKWTRRKFVFSNFGATNFNQEWKRKQTPWERVRFGQRAPTILASPSVQSPSTGNIPSIGDPIQYRKRQKRRTLGVELRFDDDDENSIS